MRANVGECVLFLAGLDTIVLEMSSNDPLTQEQTADLVSRMVYKAIVKAQRATPSIP